MGLLGQVVATVSFTPQLPIVYSYALYRQTIVFIFLDTFSMSSSLACSKASHASFWKRKVYSRDGRQGKLN
jgi:hypothetical protein